MLFFVVSNIGMIDWIDRMKNRTARLMDNERGFSLIELMMSAAISSGLATVTSCPVMGKAQDQEVGSRGHHMSDRLANPLGSSWTRNGVTYRLTLLHRTVFSPPWSFQRTK